jgi:uncharacterized protein YdhG (YjbR/CyaY superfamily)
MTSAATHVEQYLHDLEENRREVVSRLREVIKTNLPKGFEETMSYGMIGYVVPKSIYPSGYHCDTKLPLPFINLASQKNFIALYHMGLYANEVVLNWFTEEYKKRVPTKLDMGKSCLRFKKIEHIPFELIGELCQKISVEDWIRIYENQIKR